MALWPLRAPNLSYEPSYNSPPGIIIQAGRRRPRHHWGRQIQEARLQVCNVK